MAEIEILKRTQDISAEILKIIGSSEEYCYIVTPYLKEWTHLDTELSIAKNQNKKIVFLLSDIPKENDRVVNYLHKKYDFEVHLIKNLHAKIYLNESRAIIGSMNLYDYSQQNNFESAVLINSKMKVREIKKEIIESYFLDSRDHTCYKSKEIDKKITVKIAASFIPSETTFKWKGYCVLCGNQMTLDRSEDYIPVQVICYHCEQNNWSFKKYVKDINFCHFCGETHQSDSERPLHWDCYNQRKKVLVDGF